MELQGGVLTSILEMTILSSDPLWEARAHIWMGGGGLWPLEQEEGGRGGGGLHPALSDFLWRSSEWAAWARSEGDSLCSRSCQILSLASHLAGMASDLLRQARLWWVPWWLWLLWSLFSEDRHLGWVFWGSG